MRARSAGRSLGAGGRRMADAVLFEFLHTEMVAELWAHDPDSGPGAVPGDAGLQGGAGHPQVPVQRPVDGRVPEADGQPPHQPPGFSSAQGTYVLQDNSFPLLIRMASGLQYLEEAPKFLAFTCGLLRGTLCTLGVKSLVTASVAALPACKFQVVIQKS
ncbi:trafficking protein particle complex subunit 6A isoform X15 [Equus przewalskii]|uniref:Trafficking protein particle complex subunit 6A isoform X15 n=1 Tax=Equus przewalskii TaxID=9798 RepID=A0ABM4QHX8_EQUPR